MDLSSLTNTPGARKRAKRVGRGCGSGMGKTSTRGHKGQNARKGHKQKLGFEGGQMPLVRRLPKRGFNNFEFRVEALGVNVSTLEKLFNAGDEITVATLAVAAFALFPFAALFFLLLAPPAFALAFAIALLAARCLAG